MDTVHMTDLKVIGHIPPTHINPCDGVWDGEALIHRRRVRNTVTNVQHNASRPAW